MEQLFVPKSPLGRSVAENRSTILEVAARLHAHNVRVFGSVMRGDDGPTSDVDFLVDFDESAKPLDVLKLESDLERALGVRVDVGTPSSLRSLLRDEVLAEAAAF
jgi:uncharacterized protein